MKRSDWISLAALLLSCGSLYVSYISCDPRRQEIDHLAKLKVDQAEARYGEDRLSSYAVKVTNVGDSPAKEVKVGITVAEGVEAPRAENVTTDPPHAAKVTISDRLITVEFGVGLAHDQSVRVTVSGLKVVDRTKLFSSLETTLTNLLNPSAGYLLMCFASCDDGLAETRETVRYMYPVMVVEKPDAVTDPTAKPGTSR